MNSNLRICRVCNQSLEEEKHYYKIKKNGHKYISRCISCDNLRRSKYVIKVGPKGVKTIKDGLLASILQDLNSGLNMKQTAIKNNINYYALLKYNKLTPLKTVNLSRLIPSAFVN